MLKLLFKIIIITKHFLLNSVNLFKKQIAYIQNLKNNKRTSSALIICSKRTRFHYQSGLILITNWILVICLLCDHLKLTQSRRLLCTPCEIKNEIGKKVSSSNDGDKSELAARASYEEYVFEHQVTRKQAIDALRLLNDSFFNELTDSGCKAFDCTKHLKYCLGSQFLNDHCFCEQSHSTEGLPFVPHSCYVGEENKARTKPSIGSCFKYAEIKDCCCIRPLAKRWKYLSSTTIISTNVVLIILLLAFLTLFNKKLNFKLR